MAQVLCSSTCKIWQYISSPCSCEDDVVCTNCTKCKPGTYVQSACNGRDPNVCPSCRPGYFSSVEQQSSCSPCQAGYYAASSSATICAACPSGKYSGPGNASCSLCSIGTFSNSPASPQCTACPNGTYASGVGSVICTPCARGFNQSQQQSASCQACPPGTFAGAEGTALCSACSPGTYAAGNQSLFCVACPPGTRENLEGSNACKNCTAGTANHGAGLLDATCPACGPGFYSMQGATLCTLCPTGTFSAANGTANQCTACSPGNYTDQAGSTQCKICPAGTFSTLGNTQRCMPCPTGFFSSKAGSTNCTACQDGVTFANVSGSVACTPCSVPCTNGTEEQLRPCNSTWNRLCARCSTKQCTMVARSFRENGVFTLSDAIVADILVVGGGQAGSALSRGGDPGTLVLQLNYTLPAGTYAVTIGNGGFQASIGGSDSSLGDLFVARGGSGTVATNNVVNGINGIGPTLSSSYVVLESYASSGVQQMEVPDRDMPFMLCSEMGIACSVQMASAGKNAGDSAAVPNTGSGGDGGSYGGSGGSGIVVIRMLGLTTANISVASCVSSCIDLTINSIFASSQSITFENEIMVDLLLVGGGSGGTNSTGGGSGAVIFFREFLMPAGMPCFVFIFVILVIKIDFWPCRTIHVHCGCRRCNKYEWGRHFNWKLICCQGWQCIYWCVRGWHWQQQPGGGWETGGWQRG